MPRWPRSFARSRLLRRRLRALPPSVGTFRVFFFSSRRRHTRFDCDWSSDVCSSDLFAALEGPEAGTYFRGRGRFVHGRATIEVPEAFQMTTEEEGLTVHLTPIGGLAKIGRASCRERV